MANESEKIEATLKKLAKELNSLFDEDQCLKSIQILLPVSPQKLSQIKRYTLAGERGKYQEITGKFTGEHKGRVEYSLFYLQYDEPYKYREIDCELEINEVEFDSVVSEPIGIKADKRKRLSDPDKLTETWNRWVDKLKKSGYAKSTLWSYIKINHHDLAEIQASDNVNDSNCIIIAAFLTFNKYFDENVDDNALKLSVANKKVQDYLHTLTLSLFTKEIKKTTLLAKIADIINRNYAHHIGSHVSRRSSLEKILERLGANVNNGLDKGEVASIAKMGRRLEKYKDERSEFIASVTSSPVSQVFNFYTDIIRPFTENTLLIDNIARNEGICYQKKKEGKLELSKKLSNDGNTLSQLVIRVFIHEDLFSGEHDEEHIRFRDDLSEVPDNYMEQRVIYEIKENDKYDSLSIPYYIEHTDLQNTFYEKAEPVWKDFQVNTPGALGKHAIYSLLENYIRNVAKHSYNHDKHKGKPVEIILKVTPDENALDKFKLILTDNISDNKIKDTLNQKILKSITDKNIGMGIADMKICTCLLAEKELSDKNLRETLKADKDQDSGHLAYELQLSKPKNVALIGVEKIRENPSEGVFFYENLEAYLDSSFSNFQFAIVDGGNIKVKTLQKHKNKLPLRLLIMTDKKMNYKDSNRYKFVSEINSEDLENLLEWCWKQWVSSKTNEKRTHLGVYFEQSKNDSLTNKWLEIQQNNENQEGKLFSMTVHFKGKDLEISPDLPINKPERHIYYDRHAGLARKTLGKGIHFREENFWELIDKNNSDFDIITSADINQDPCLLPYELVDAATTNILVIDERVAEMAHYGESSDTHLNEALIHLGGFEKQNRIGDAPAHLFDACWASGIYVATHLCGKPLSNSIKIGQEDELKKHYLNVMFRKNGNKISVESRTNVKLSKSEFYEINKTNNNIDKILSYKFFKQYDCLLIHRTKLKDLIENSFGENFLTVLNISKIFVVTGGGVIDILPDKKAVTVLPSNILHDYILGRRPSKYLLTKILR